VCGRAALPLSASERERSTLTITAANGEREQSLRNSATPILAAHRAPMAENTPPAKKRRPRAELMIESGVEVLAVHGVETQISSVSYAKVFEHLERTRKIRVNYGSVHERIWNSGAGDKLAVNEFTQVFAQADLTTKSGAQQATQETAHVLMAEYIRTTADKDERGAWLETVTALKSGPTGSLITQAARDGALASYEHQTNIYREGPWEALKMVSATPNELVPADVNVEDILAAISIAIADGLELRRHLTAEYI